MKIYHNPRCHKSRETLSLIQKKGVEVEIVEYMKTLPTYDELKDVIMKLNCKPIDIVRKEEKIFKQRFKNKNFTDEEWIQILTEIPSLIQRPIVVKQYKAIIGRPPENVLELI